MPKTLRAIHANRGVEAKYKKKLKALIDEMVSSIEWWVTAGYRQTPALAQDADLDDLAARWVARFDEYAPIIAESFARGMFKSTDFAFQQALKDAGWSVDFKMTPAMRQVFDATIAENVSLIKSIPERYLTQVQGVVSRSYTMGRDLQTMVAELKKLYPEASRRAVLIARDQSNKANAVVNRTRQLELGLTEAKWHHSHAGKNPRPEHVAANGKTYKIAEGCFISGEFIQPGEDINCRCTSRVILPI